MSYEPQAEHEPTVRYKYKKDNAMLCCIKNNIESCSEDVVLLYSARPHLESCMQFLPLHFKKEIGKLEHIQTRAIKRVRDVETKPY